MALQASDRAILRVRGTHDVVVLDICVGRLVWNIDAKIVVETSVDRPAGNSPGPIDSRRRHAGVEPFGNRPDKRPLQTQVPFAKPGGAVSAVAEYPRDRQAFFGNQGLVPHVQNAELQMRTPTLLPGQQAVAAWGAESRRRVRVRKAHSLRGQPIEVGRTDL